MYIYYLYLLFILFIKCTISNGYKRGAFLDKRIVVYLIIQAIAFFYYKYFTQTRINKDTLSVGRKPNFGPNNDCMSGKCTLVVLRSSDDL